MIIIFLIKFLIMKNTLKKNKAVRIPVKNILRLTCDYKNNCDNISFDHNTTNTLTNIEQIDINTNRNNVIDNAKQESLSLESESQMYQKIVELNHKSTSGLEEQIEQIPEKIETNESVCDQKPKLLIFEEKEEEAANNKKIIINNISPSKTLKKNTFKRNPAMYLITKTLKENDEEQKKKIKLEKEKECKIESNEDIEKFPKKTNNENLYPEKENNKPLNVINTSEKESELLTLNKSENELSLEQTKNICYNDLFNGNIINNKSALTSYDSFERRKPINRYEKLLNLVQRNDDVFNLSSEFALAICISKDLQFLLGAAVDFKYKFGKIGVLMDQNLKVGDIGKIIHNEQFIFYLVVKEKCGIPSSKNILEKVFLNLLNKMTKLNLTKLAFPKNGFDCTPLQDALELISKVFEKSNIEVSICQVAHKLNHQRANVAKIYYTPKKLWEMEPQTDLIIFINMNQMYLDNWQDEVVDNINARYPFKNRLLNDINIKPVAPGDILYYKIQNEVLFCIFFVPAEQNQSYYECLEKAFIKMKSAMTGYRYLGVQRNSVNNQSPVIGPSRDILLLQTVFNSCIAEIWLCNDSDSNKANQLKHYNTYVNASLEKNRKEYARPNSKRGIKMERKKYSSYGNTKTNGSIAHNYYDNKRNSQAPAGYNKTTSSDNYTRNDWKTK